MADARNKKTRITIDVGTAYDFITSLQVLFDPKFFGVRAPWASGMLARLNPESRDALSRLDKMLGCPHHCILQLPEPRSAEAYIWHLSQLEPMERLRELSSHWELCGGLCDSEYISVLEQVAGRKRWDAADQKKLTDALKEAKPGEKIETELLTETLDAWADAEAFSNAYLDGLKNYYDVFFQQEQERILPAIQAAGARIEKLASELDLPDLIEEISSGLRFEDLPEVEEYILAPSFWMSPLTAPTRIDANRMLFVFGARPAEDSVVPGETVPDGLIHTLKALSDPTRLKILRLIAEKPMGAAELARALRLRSPTVLHHMHRLRLSGMVQVRVPEANTRQRSLFSLRPQGVRAMMTTLNAFLHTDAALAMNDDETTNND